MVQEIGLVQFNAIVCGLIVLILTGCSSSFWVRPEGQIEKGVSFSFRRSQECNQPRELFLGDITVEKLENGSWQTVWSTTGIAGRESRITYGISPLFHTEVVPPQPLKSGGRYRITVWDMPPDWVGPSSRTVIFTLDEMGIPVVDPI